MGHVRKVTHASGVASWRATVRGLDGKRRSKNFDLKRAADVWTRENEGAGATGSSGMTLRQLALDHGRWFDGLVRAGERGQITADGYASHLRVHLEADAAAAATKLCDLSTPLLQSFLDRLLARTGSAETARRVKKSLSAWCAHGARQGWIVGNPVDACKVVEKRKRRSATIRLPQKEALGRLLDAAATGAHSLRDTAIVHVLMFAGLRISELLGMPDDAATLRRPGVDGRGGGGVLDVRERLCTRHVTLDVAKSDEGMREVPIGPAAAAALRAWRVARGPSPIIHVEKERVAGRLFPAPPDLTWGGLWAYGDFMRLCWMPLLLRAGLASVERDGKAKKRTVTDFGPHTLRHVYASIQIESGVTPKRLQALLGHATLAMTMDLYGHLWTDPAGDQALAEAAERAIPRTN